jgi:hypothetical protein
MSLKEIMHNQRLEGKIYTMTEEWCSMFNHKCQTSHLVHFLSSIYGNSYNDIFEHLCKCVHSRLTFLPDEDDIKLIEKFENEWILKDVQPDESEGDDVQPDESEGDYVHPDESEGDYVESEDEEVLSYMISMYKDRH